MRAIALLLVGATLPLAGCGLHLGLVDASVKKPSNVAVYFSVRTARGEPVPNLAPENFKVYEDDKLVSQFESKQTILNPEIAAVHYTLLLMDMSGSVVASGALGDLVTAASAFTERVSKTQQVAVYAFDGSKEIHPIVGFSSNSARSGINALQSFHSRDPSTNLNGGVIEALKVLEKQMEHASQPLRFASLVVFTDGSDRAHRVSREDLSKALDEAGTTVSVFVIGVGAEIDESELKAIGRTDAVLSKDPGQAKAAFDRMAGRVEAFTRSFYLFSYCSPARDGEHDVRLVADAARIGSGDITYHFNAHGFAANCDPNTHPAFDVRHPRTELH
jgi:hypothetical protein